MQKCTSPHVPPRKGLTPLDRKDTTPLDYTNIASLDRKDVASTTPLGSSNPRAADATNEEDWRCHPDCQISYDMDMKCWRCCDCNCSLHITLADVAQDEYLQSYKINCMLWDLSQNGVGAIYISNGSHADCIEVQALLLLQADGTDWSDADIKTKIMHVCA